MLKVLYEDKECLVAEKPQGMPVQPDPTGDADLLRTLEEMLGRPLYLIHRLDRTVGGAVLLAKTRSCAARLSEDVQKRRIEKRYLAICEGDLPPEGLLKDLLLHDKRRRMAFVVDRMRGGVKEATLSYRILATYPVDGHPRHLLEVTLITGRFHQIRAQLASRGCPLLGDGKYGSHRKCPLALHAARLTFMGAGGRVTVDDMPDTDTVPWLEFFEEIHVYAASQHDGHPSF